MTARLPSLPRRANATPANELLTPSRGFANACWRKESRFRRSSLLRFTHDRERRGLTQPFGTREATPDRVALEGQEVDTAWMDALTARHLR
jgi:hypothetical protein